jgi:hypothetical protein
VSLAKLETPRGALDLVRATMTRARRGRAVLDAVIADGLQDTGLERGAPVRLELAARTVFNGGAWRVGRQGGFTRLVAVSALELDTPIAARYYENTDAVLIARDILRDAGALEGNLNLAAAYPRYTRSSDTGAAALTALCDSLKATWRTRLDGRVDMMMTERRTPAERPLEWGDDLLEQDATCQEFTCFARPDLEPGQIVDANPYGEPGAYFIERVMHCLDSSIRTKVYWSPA